MPPAARLAGGQLLGLTPEEGADVVVGDKAVVDTSVIAFADDDVGAELGDTLCIVGYPAFLECHLRSSFGSILSTWKRA